MIKNILFDLGGVILNIDYQRTSEAFKMLGVENFDQLYSQAQQSHLFDKLETGTITEADFRNEIRIISGINLTNEQIDKAWNAMLLDLPKERIDLLQKVRNNYKTFLLSNTNSIHLKAYTENLFQQHSIKSLAELFDKEYFSHILQLRKPDTNAFHHILKENFLNADETLFIDDSIQHVVGAKKAGLKAFHLNLNERNISVMDLFSDGWIKEEMINI